MARVSKEKSCRDRIEARSLAAVRPCVPGALASFAPFGSNPRSLARPSVGCSTSLCTRMPRSRPSPTRSPIDRPRSLLEHSLRAHATLAHSLLSLATLPSVAHFAGEHPLTPFARSLTPRATLTCYAPFTLFAGDVRSLAPLDRSHRSPTSRAKLPSLLSLATLAQSLTSIAHTPRYAHSLRSFARVLTSPCHLQKHQ